MAIWYVLTEELRVRLKQPLGVLLEGSFAETMRKFRDLVITEKPIVIISVGDTVSRNLVSSGFFPVLAIIDNKCMRKPAQSALIPAEMTVRVKNPRGTISEQAVKAVQDSLRTGKRVKMIVDGEEDLLALIAIRYAPENSYVVYGQPREGIVVVKVTLCKQTEISEILAAMQAGKAK